MISFLRRQIEATIGGKPFIYAEPRILILSSVVA